MTVKFIANLKPRKIKDPIPKITDPFFDTPMIRRANAVEIRRKTAIRRKPVISRPKPRTVFVKIHGTIVAKKSFPRQSPK